MLVQFSFKNYGPFKEEAVFDMRAVKAYKEHPHTLIDVPKGDPLLKVAAIYGANASGKSNFVKAYQCFVRLVQESFQHNNKDDKDDVLSKSHFPFMLDANGIEEDVEFEGIYSYNGLEYRYGYAFNESTITSEWLYTRSSLTARESVILEREGDVIELGSSVRRTCEKYLTDIDDDVLALSFFSSLKLGNTVFKDTAYQVSSILPLLIEGRIETKLALQHYFSRYYDEEEKKSLLKFINGIDVGIQDILVEKNPNNNDKVSIYAVHKGIDNELHSFPLEIESDGTRRAIALYSFVRLAIEMGKGLIIDEFNSQLHPLLQKYIVDLFYEEGTTGQLIYTTHDTTFLDKRYVRRDQIWFVSKDENGESTMYSLADFKLRNDKSFDKDYLSGAFGGIPILKDISLKEE